MRSNEFDSRIELQNHIAGLFGFPAVTYIHYGRYNVIGATTQGREIRALIETGDYIGWDDPRLVTIRALRRRGILKEAFYELAQKIGLSKSQTNLDFTTIAAINRKLLDKDAKRYFCVLDPVEVEVSGLPADLKQFSLAYHPEGRKGERILPATAKYYLERKDHEAAPEGEVLRFMDAMNVRKRGDRYEFVSLLYDDYVALQKKGSLIHFVPKDGQEVSLEVLLPDLTVKKGVGEANLKALQAGEVIQFERYAFCRLDSHDGNSLKFWFTHE
jgi:glutamyl-tRNA synthetase